MKLFMLIVVMVFFIHDYVWEHFVYVFITLICWRAFRFGVNKIMDSGRELRVWEWDQPTVHSTPTLCNH